MIDLGAAAQRLLSPTLFREGFSLDGRSEWSITFRDERRSIEFSYYREDPTPWLNVTLGLRVSDAELVVALWRLYAEVAPLATLGVGRFDSLESLAARLVVIRDGWLDRLVWPVFQQPERFRSAWLAQQEEGKRTHEASVLSQRLRQARWAYEHGHFSRAVQQYAQVGPELSAAARRRYALARRALGPE